MDNMTKNPLVTQRSSKKIIIIIAAIICLASIAIGVISCSSYEIQGTYQTSYSTTTVFALKFKGSKIEFNMDDNGRTTSSKGTWRLTDEENKYGCKIGIIEFDAGKTDEFYLYDDGRIEFGGAMFKKQ